MPCAAVAGWSRYFQSTGLACQRPSLSAEVEIRSYASCVRSAEPAFVMIFGRYDRLTCLALRHPAECSA